MIRGPVALRIITEGQSLLNSPSYEGDIFGRSLGWHLMRSITPALFGGKGFAHRNVAISGTSLTVLRTTAEERVFNQAGRDLQTGLLMCYGTSDILGGDTGLALYNEAIEYGNAAKSAGIDWVVPTTVVGNTLNTTPQNNARLDHNELLVNHVGEPFTDGIIDLEVSPLTEWSNVFYYWDGTHGTGEWAKIVAQRSYDVISLIPSVAALL